MTQKIYGFIDEMAAVNSQYNASSGDGERDVPVKAVFTGSTGKVPTLVDYNAFASSGTTLAIANKPPLLGDRKIQLPQIPVDVDWNLTTNQGATLAIKNKPTSLDVKVLKAEVVDALEVYLPHPDKLMNFNGDPLLATVAKTGKFADLVDEPTFAAVATSGSYADLTATPTFAPVATSGSYTDLINRPAVPASALVPAGFSMMDISSAGFSMAFQSVDLSQGVSVPPGKTYVLQGFYINPFPTSVAVPANTFGTAFVGLNVYGWSFNVGNVSFINQVSAVGAFRFGSPDQTQSASQPYVGFVNNAFSSPLFNVSFSRGGQTAVPIGGPPTVYNSAAITLVPGYNEFRLVVQNPQTNVSAHQFILAPGTNFSSTPFQSIRQVFGSSTVASTGSYVDLNDKPVLQTAQFWHWGLTTTVNVLAQTAYTPQQAFYTRYDPYGNGDIMNSSGIVTVPTQGIYSVSIQSNWQNSTAGLQTYVLSSMGAIGYLIKQGPTSDPVSSGSWTGFLLANSTLTPTFYTIQANTLNADAFRTCHFTVTLLYAQ